MNKKCIYIGNNLYFLDKIKQVCFYIKIFQQDYPLLALNHIKNDPEIEIVVFEATPDITTSIDNIKFLKENLPQDIQLFVVTLRKSHTRELFAAGADDVFSIAIKPVQIKKRIAFLTKFKKEKIEISKDMFRQVEIPLWKRTMDIILSSLAILILLPFFLLIAVLIRIESKGKVFYAAKRVGREYKIFNFYKFRSMYSDADKNLSSLEAQNQYANNINNDDSLKKAQNNILGDTFLVDDDEMILERDFLKQRKEKQENNFFKVANDPRITKVGRFIRNTSIDELPQLFNILKGDMSIVGNRPLPPYEAEMLTTDRWAKRFLAPAGLTGLWQVTKRGGANKMSADERKQLDIDYINNLSFWKDLKIIFMTLPAMLQHENV